jgi:hypothetical protein
MRPQHHRSVTTSSGLHQRAAFKLLVGLLFIGAAFPCAAQLGPVSPLIPIVPAANDYSPPSRQFVLPVIFVTADVNPNSATEPLVPNNGAVINDLLDSYEIDPGATVTDPTRSNEELDFVRAVANISQGLRLTQEKYRRMLRPRIDIGIDQGSFHLATWRYTGTDTSGLAFFFRRDEALTSLVRPVVVQGARQHDNASAVEAEQGYSQIAHPGGGIAGTGDADNVILGEVYDALGCSRYNCPFVPVVFYAAPEPGGAHRVGLDEDTCYHNSMPQGISGGGAKWNRGLNHGGGAVLVPYQGAINGNHDHRLEGGVSRFLSVLVHELGHTASVADIKDASSTYYTALSIMSYSDDNNQGDCWSGNGRSVKDPASGFCRLDPDYANEAAANFSDDRYTNIDSPGVDRYPGVLAPRERWAIGYYSLLFESFAMDPELDYDCSLYANRDALAACTDRTLALTMSRTERAIVGHGSVTMTASTPGQSGDPNSLFGASAISFASSEAGYDKMRMWRSAAGTTSQLCVNFPTEREQAELGKVIVYTGTTSGATRVNRATNVTLSVGNLGSFNGSPIWFLTVPTFTKTTSNAGGDYTLKVTSATAGHRWCVHLTAPSATSVVDVRGLRMFMKDGSELFAPAEASILEASETPSGGTNANLVGTGRTIVTKTTTALDPKTMWRAPTNSAQWVTVTVEFPNQVSLGKVLVYSGYKASGTTITDVAHQVLLWRRNESGNWQLLLSPPTSDDSKKSVTVAAGNSRAKLWKIALRARTSGGSVVVRGLRFFDREGGELFAPFTYPASE